MRLIESSEPGEVMRHNVRAHYIQRQVLVAAVCRELQRCPDDLVGGRPQAALNVLNQWMRHAYEELPKDRDVDYKHGLDDSRLAQYASDLRRELELGTKVCEAYSILFTADTRGEYEADCESISERLNEYAAEID